MYTAVSAMGSCDQVLKGRPYGGSAIIYWANLASVISVCATHSDCFCAVILGGKKLLVISVYLATDYGMSAGEYSFLHCLNELAGFLSAKRCGYLLIAGDFNVDFGRIHRQHTSLLSDMMKDFDLEVVDLQYSTAVQFTYERDDGGAHSWVDHFFDLLLSYELSL